jgi:hypothetical protein
MQLNVSFPRKTISGSQVNMKRCCLFVVVTLLCLTSAQTHADSQQLVLAPSFIWKSQVTHTNDPTYQRLILPWLKEHKLELNAEGDGLLVVYQPWGFVSAAILFVPGKTEGVLTLFDSNNRSTRQSPLSRKEWETVRQLALDGKFFDLPYKNDKFGMDGASVYVEARIEGRHHRVCHWEPDSPVIQRLANLIGRRPDSYYPIDRATAGAGWQAVSRAMWAGDKEALARVCTENGYQSFVKGLNGKTTAKDLNTWAQAWGNWPLTFTSETAESADAHFGPAVGKQHRVRLLKTTDGWKLDQWMPGGN